MYVILPGQMHHILNRNDASTLGTDIGLRVPVLGQGSQAAWKHRQALKGTATRMQNK